jgi:NTE family protein
MDKSRHSFIIAFLCILVSADSLWAQEVHRGDDMQALKTLMSQRGTPTIALVLSGGSAKGLAHIGVLDVLDSAHIPIDLIVGTSMGAAIGGLYAVGYTPKQLETFALTTNWQDVLDFDDDSHRTERLFSQKDQDNSVLSLRFTGFFHPVLPQAISSGERLTMLLNSMVVKAPGVVGQDFLRDFRVPFIALATDIVTGNRRLIHSGDLTSAMRASVTLPLRFTPLSEDTAILVDGGLSSNIPVDIAKDSAGADVAVVSNTTAALHSRENLNAPWEVADQVISLMMQRLSRASLARADVVITPPIEIEGNDFQNVAAIIESGREAARKMLPKLLALTLRRSGVAEVTPDPQDADKVLDSLGKVRLHTYGATIPDTVRKLLRKLDIEQLPIPVTLRSLKTNVETPIVEAYHSRGFTLARIDSVEVNTRDGSLDIFLDKGRIGSIVVLGSAAKHPEVVTREFPLSKGDIFRASDVERGLSNLTSTGYFDFASIEVVADSGWRGTKHSIVSNSVSNGSGTHPPENDANLDDTLHFGPSVRLTVQERAPNVLRLGVLADNEFGAQFSTELANEDLFNTGTRVSLKGGVGSLSRYAALTFEAPRILRTNATMLLQGYSNYQDVSLYTSVINPEAGRITSEVTDQEREARDYGARLKLGGEVGRIAEFSAEIRTERQSYFSTRVQDPQVTQLQVAAVKGQLDVDSRNDRDFPQQGTYLSAYYEVGTKLLGSATSYTKIFATTEQTIALSSLHTIIPKISVGYADVTLPRLEQFSLGGIESFYGLNDYESRGAQMVLGSLTYQIAIPHALFFPTFVSFRYDLGATWLEPTEIKFEDLIHGIGGGIGLKTPLGVARFAIGENFRFNRNEPTLIDRNSLRYYFSIGSNL